MIHFIGEGYQHVDIGSDFPEVGYFELNVSYSIFVADIDFASDCLELAFLAFFQVEVGEDQFLIVLVGPDADFGVIVDLGVGVFVGPLIILWDPDSYGLAILVETVVGVVG